MPAAADATRICTVASSARAIRIIRSMVRLASPRSAIVTAAVDREAASADHAPGGPFPASLFEPAAGSNSAWPTSGAVRTTPSMSADTPVIDLGYRPQSHFWPITHDTHVIAAIKGERRRSAIRAAVDADTVTPLDALYATPTLPDEHWLALGRLHLSFMGGGNRPDRRDTEVEIARISIDSTTSDVTSIYAKVPKDRIRYRVVKEYWSDSLTDNRTRSARRHLSLGALIECFLAA